MGLVYDAIIKIVSFAMGGVISLSVLSFSFYKLSQHLDTNEQSIYIGIMCSIISLYIPSPVGLLTNLNNSNTKTNIQIPEPQTIKLNEV